MTQTSIQDFFTGLLVVFYLATTAVHLLAFWQQTPLLLKLKTPLLLITGIFHLLEFVTLFVLENRIPIHSVPDITSAVALMMLLCYFILESIKSADIKNSGGFIAFCATLLQVASSFLPRDIPSSLTSNFFIDSHIIAVILGGSGIFISGVYSFLYLALYYSIKKNYFGAFFERIPSLETMQNMSSGSATIGFFFFSVAFGLGIVASAGYPWLLFSEPKLISILVIWLIYGTTLFLKQRFKLQGEKLAIALFICFGITFAFLLTINFLGYQFHRGI